MTGAHLHLMLNHIPVLGSVAVLLLYSIYFFKKDESFLKFSMAAAVLFGALAFPVYFSGEYAEDVVEALPGVTHEFVEAHEELALIALVAMEAVALVSLFGLWRSRRGDRLTSGVRMLLGVATVISVGLMLTTAYRGGQIRHTEIRPQTSTEPMN